MLMLMLIMDTGEAMVDGDGEGMEDITDHGDMGIGDVRRGQLTRKLLLGPMLTLMPMPMLGMATMAMAWDTDMAWDMVMGDITGHGDMDMADTTDHGDMDTGEERRGPLTMK